MLFSTYFKLFALVAAPFALADNHYNCDCHDKNGADNVLTIQSCDHFPGFNAAYNQASGQCYSQQGIIGGDEWQEQCQLWVAQGFTYAGVTYAPGYTSDVSGHCD